jgi:predicted nucleic acid-binding protein
LIALDTSVVVRYLVGRPADMALRARSLIDGADRLGLPTLVLLETGHVLGSRYGVKRGDAIEILLDFVTLRNLEVLGLPKEVAIQALARARQYESAPFADSLIASTAQVGGAESIATFDRQMRRHGLPVMEP